MIIKEFNGLNVIVDKKLELMFALHAIHLKNHPEFKEELDFIEVPPIPYIDELEQIINSKEHSEIIDAIMKFEDEATCVNIALGFDDNYNFDKSKARMDHIINYLGGVDIDEFVKKFKNFALAIEWDKFFYEHKEFYQNLFIQFCNFPSKLNLGDIKDFYGSSATSYNYIPSILINGGFSHEDVLGNYYYLRGIQWYNKTNNFYYDIEYLLECLFHEFSHPIVNPLVDANILSFTNIDTIFEDAINNGLVKTYCQKNTLLYEYFVRANAYILAKKYYPDDKIDDWILENGFAYLNEIVDFTSKEMSKYTSYEEFFVSEMVPFMNNILKYKKTHK